MNKAEFETAMMEVRFTVAAYTNTAGPAGSHTRRNAKTLEEAVRGQIRDIVAQYQPKVSSGL